MSPTTILHLPALALPSIMVYSMEGYATGLCGSAASGACGAGNCEGVKLGEVVSPVDGFPGYVARRLKFTYIRRSKGSRG